MNHVDGNVVEFIRLLNNPITTVGFDELEAGDY